MIIWVDAQLLRIVVDSASQTLRERDIWKLFGGQLVTEFRYLANLAHRQIEIDVWGCW